LRRFHRAYAFSRNSQPFGKNRLRAWTELCECVHRAGCRKLVLLSSHGGNNAVLETIAHDLRARLDMLVVIATWRRFGAPDGLFSSHELTHGIHGGEVETSLMLAFRPSLVRLEEAEDFPYLSAEMEREFNWLSTNRPTGFLAGWRRISRPPARLAMRRVQPRARARPVRIMAPRPSLNICKTSMASI
jgi:creatinine amidohydrolase/Fe(II)-dependent formamide hydrolase-like protein